MEYWKNIYNKAHVFLLLYPPPCILHLLLILFAYTADLTLFEGRAISKCYSIKTEDGFTKKLINLRAKGNWLKVKRCVVYICFPLYIMFNIWYIVYFSNSSTILSWVLNHVNLVCYHIDFANDNRIFKFWCIIAIVLD